MAGPSGINSCNNNDAPQSNTNTEHHYCETCECYIPHSNIIGHRRINKHKANILIPTNQNNVSICRSAFKKRIISYKISSSEHHIYVYDFIKEINDYLFEILTNEVRKHNCVKVNVELFGSYI